MKWTQDEYTVLTRDYQAFKQELTKYKQAFAHRKDAQETTQNLKEANETLNKLSTRLSSLVAEAADREEAHQKRLYILKGLREVCASLGFEEVAEPRYEKESDFNSPVLQTFDTVNEGSVTFKIHLRNLIESDSGIRVEACEDEFGKVSDLLASQYGVQTSFKRVGQEAAPKRISKTEKPMPESQPETSQQFND